MFPIVNYLPSTVTHYGINDGRGNTWPACGQRIGRYALPNPSPSEVPTCKRCAKL
jgi:hypothetical protein